eukprot:CAMPEP_0118927866 /NCGR_PEP_ID=MMETSP1169-20130426/5250_1 /TAXON_ID=36882 /ORGANISM="Pyramimonas obovata, Strain CCMP722" /LENGTH=147 /DNA_ID=CAMNT_0006869723 /DNA_START=195 /DNA_END=638 /DNA_ORIENTATION=-
MTPMNRLVTSRNKEKDGEWPLWFDTKASLVRSPPCARRVATCGPRPYRINASVSRRAATVALVVCASGAGESRAETDAQKQAKAVAEAQAQQAADIKKRTQEQADRIKAQQAAAISKTQAQQAKDVAKAEKDQAALKKFLMGLFGFK